MLIVTDINGITEPLTDYQDLNRKRRVNGEHSLSFLLYGTQSNQHGFPLVLEESTIEYDNQTYVIKRIDEKPIGETSVKRVQANHVLFNLIDTFEYGIIGGSGKTLTELVAFVLAGTNFTHTISGTFPAQTVFNFGEQNKLELLWQLLDMYGAEIDVNGTHITFTEQIGQDNHFQFRFKHNLKTLSRSVTTNNLTTYIKGYGNGISAEYTSPMSSVYGIRHATLFKDDSYTDQAVLLERIKREINDTPEITFSIEYSQLDNDSLGLGDVTYLIYEPINIDIMARIMEMNEYPEEPHKTSVTIANYQKTFADALISLNKTVQTVEKKTEVNRSEINQTNQNIELKVSKDDVVSTINQSAEAISISAEKLNLAGAVTFSSFAPTLQSDFNSKEDATGVTTIIDGRITTDYVNALGITAGRISADNITGGTITGVVFRSYGTNPWTNNPQELELDSGGLEIQAKDAGGVANKGYAMLHAGQLEIGSGNPQAGNWFQVYVDQATGDATMNSSSTLKLTGNVNFTNATVTGLTATAKFG